MKRWVLYTLTLVLISTLAAAQAVVTPYGTATQQGAAVPVAPVSPPLVTTPIMHLGNAPTTPGTSTAAIALPGTTSEPPSAVPIRPEISLGPETIYIGPAGASAVNSNATTPNIPAIINGRQVFDRGVNSNAAAAFNDGTNGRPLGDIARDNRQRSQNANAKTFTNADVERMAGTGGISGIATNPTNNNYPSDNGVINSNAAPGAVAAPSNPATPPTNEQNVPPPNEKPSAATTPHEMAQAQTPANPADQNAQAASAQNGEQKTLPRAASPLPLIALIGLMTIVAAFFVRKVKA